MVSTADRTIIDLWLARQASPHTRSCNRRDATRLIDKLRKPLTEIALGDLQRFADGLEDSGLAPISRLRTLAAVKSLFGFCQRIQYIPANPASELALPTYEHRLAERVLSEDDVSASFLWKPGRATVFY